ncbi:cation:proton antiporter [Levilactobacillus lindianensis]|uniref:cation:proton antiporter n=1 Tax=Levilactobacillus lindianensis TaxID=2486018 RepID=UPI000F74899C|nr:sodium:proton antiporter [Levilactobacillus lindianensis]
MPIIEAVILLIVLVLLSNIISHYLTFIPVSLIQIVLGLVVALVWKFEVPLETDWFLLLFIAPLLYNDGRRFPRRELWRLRGPIFANAIWLVFLTTLLGGYLIYALIPKMPLTVAFALAAILSPTDPVAVQSIAKQVKLPASLMHLVSGESLINDASGLIAFKYAVAATVTGAFSMGTATGDFIYISIVGFISGLIFMTAIQLLMDILRRQGIDDVIFNTVLQIATPFVIYLVTEEITHASGVIAVVTAGVLYHARENRIVEDTPELKLVTEKVWDIIIYSLNGIVFVILGIELPVATSQVIKGGQFNTGQAIFFAFMAWVILVAIRTFWTYGYILFQRLTKSRSQEKPSFRMAVLSGLSGVRGAVTMAGVLSVPATIASGASFPTRALMLFVASGVIIISLVAATIMLPLISTDKQPLQTRASVSDEIANEIDLDDEVEEEFPEEPVRQVSEEEARAYIMRLAISKIEELRRPNNQRAAYDLILDYQFIIRRLEMSYRADTAMQKVLDDEIKLREVAISGERESLESLLEGEKITQTSYVGALRRIEKLESRLTQVSGHTMPGVMHYWVLFFRHMWRNTRYWLHSEDTDRLHAENNLIERETAKNAIKALSQYLARTDVDETQFDNQAVYHLIVHYRNRIERAKAATGPSHEDDYQHQLNKLRVRALGAERNGIQTLLEAGNISWTKATHLRQYVNYAENVLVMSLSNEEGE